MGPTLRFRCRVIVPLAITAALLWLLVGCLYIPTPERLHLTGSRQDFRPLVGRPGSQRAIVERRISRAAVEALLGPPPYASANGRRLMYVIHLKKGILIMPLCFTVATNEDRTVGVITSFDQAGMLTDWEQLETMRSFSLLGGGIPEERFVEGDLVSIANRSSRFGASSQPASVKWELKSTRDAKAH